MIDNFRRPQHILRQGGAVIVLAGAFVLLQPHTASAQTSVTTTGGTINKIPKWSPTTTSLTDSAIYDNGNVGIGTPSPGTKLDVNGDVRVLGQSSTSSYPLYFANNTTPTPTNKWHIQYVTNGLDFVESGVAERVFFKDGGNIGIGTTNPGTKLDVNGDARILGQSSTASYPLYFANLANNTTTNKWHIQLIGGGLDFVESGVAERVFFKEGGNVGIGTTNPQAKLDVVGDVNVSGNIAAKYQDMAEWVPARRAIPAGTVVVLDSELTNHVLASSRAYDTHVAGVVSAKPGVILGEGGEGKVMVATTGRVRVKVDATSAPIRVGDLLVTSDKEGIAMRSQPLDLGGTPIHRPGTLIGKALEPLEKGVGEILVLLSLQ